MSCSPLGRDLGGIQFGIGNLFRPVDLTTTSHFFLYLFSNQTVVAYFLLHFLKGRKNVKQFISRISAKSISKFYQVNLQLKNYAQIKNIKKAWENGQKTFQAL
jgi:hypothetical protein